MNNDFTLGIQGAVEPNITFLTNSNKEIMRIDKNGVKVNPDFFLDEAAQHVINAMDDYVRRLVQAEREACAKVCEKAIASIWEYSPEDVKQTGINVCNNLATAIRNRSTT